MGARPSFPIVPLPRDRTVIVTGGNTGLGYEIAKWLAMMGATVIIACRSEQRALQAIERMQEEYSLIKEKLSSTHELKTYDNLAVSQMQLDLSSFKSTLEFVEEFKKSGRNLHVLVCNAGIGMAPYEKTEDGFEKMLQVNYLSHFLIVAKLLPVMRKSGTDCRILFMSSDAHRSCSFDLDTMNYEGNASKFGRLDYYGRSKLYQVNWLPG
ncbi:WW domain-containing oxidoreductase-like [Mercenaria mercenaria]|uniref:WW domain-containing oxidoreductase-like n=1 Tax=Mercenaria mercenaria TaxID=6596 RepID=UPI00234F87FE|nr:WW domain-containing oxidoreductase-like [Mercenaria mercenaria]XP_053396321.1 WW domain-containing oxidoreductase-like [Mercenaria mercenaria]